MLEALQFNYWLFLIVLKFFSLNGNMGRLDFLKSYLLRVLLVFILVSIFSFIALITAGELFSNFLSFSEPLFSLFGILIIGPTCFRRANDLGMNYTWIILYLLVDLLPLVGLIPITTVPATPTTIYKLVIFLVLAFKPGQTHKDLIRSKDNGA